MATITFFGAAQEVTGSCHLLEGPGVGRVLLDCGMHQGGDAVDRIQDEEFAFDPATIDAVVLSHAHLDHSGLLPRLCHEGFAGPVICTRATAELLEIMLNDSAGLYLRDLERTNIRNARRGRPLLDPTYTLEDVEAFATFRLKVNARAVGPRLGGETKRVIAASKQGDWRTTPGGGVEVGGTPLEPGEYELLLDPKEGVACEPLPGNDAIAVLDLALTDALVDEGRARDLVRVVQQARKEAGLHVADRIALAVRVPEAWRASIDAFAGYVKEQTLAVSLAHGDGAEGDFAHAAGSGDEALRVALRRV